MNIAVNTNEPHTRLLQSQDYKPVKSSLQANIQPATQLLRRTSREQLQLLHLAIHVDSHAQNVLCQLDYGRCNKCD